MKSMPATTLLVFCIGWVPLSWAYPQTSVAECLDDHNASTCVAGLAYDVPATESLATTVAMQGSIPTPEMFDANAGALNTDSAATASTVATLGLFGSALVILGFFRGKRSVHRQLG